MTNEFYEVQMWMIVLNINEMEGGKKALLKAKSMNNRKILYMHKEKKSVGFYLVLQVY